MASVSSGIRRKVDDLGRVVIPAGIRRSLNIREGDAVEVSVDGERIVLSKPRDACVFCGREGDDLHRFRSRLVCRECVATIGQADEQFRAPASRPAPSGPTPTGTAAGPTRTSDDPDIAWPTGPIDGDAFAREVARRSAPPSHQPADVRTQATDDAGDTPSDEQASRSGRRPPPYDPASTTAW